MSHTNAGALIYSRNTGRFLFLLRNADKKYKGTWGLVGGRLETGERPIEGLWREIREEVGVELSDCKSIPIETFTSVDAAFIYHTFVVVVDDEFIPILNSEHRGYTWVELNDYPRPLHPGVFKTFTIKVIRNKIKVLQSLFLQ